MVAPCLLVCGCDVVAKCTFTCHIAKRTHAHPCPLLPWLLRSPLAGASHAPRKLQNPTDPTDCLQTRTKNIDKSHSSHRSHRLPLPALLLVDCASHPVCSVGVRLNLMGFGANQHARKNEVKMQFSERVLFRICCCCLCLPLLALLLADCASHRVCSVDVCSNLVHPSSCRVSGGALGGALGGSSGGSSGAPPTGSETTRKNIGKSHRSHRTLPDHARKH